MDADISPPGVSLEENKLNYPIVIGNGDLGKLYQVGNMPVTLLIDRDGKIADSHAGVVLVRGVSGSDSTEEGRRVLKEHEEKWIRHYRVLCIVLLLSHYPY